MKHSRAITNGAFDKLFPHSECRSHDGLIVCDESTGYQSRIADGVESPVGSGIYRMLMLRVVSRPRDRFIPIALLLALVKSVPKARCTLDAILIAQGCVSNLQLYALCDIEQNVIGVQAICLITCAWANCYQYSANEAYVKAITMNACASNSTEFLHRSYFIHFLHGVAFT